MSLGQAERVDTTELLVVFVASFLGAFIKGVTGMGYPVVAVPLISLVLGVEDAVVIVALPNFAANSFLCWEARDARGESRDLGLFVGLGVLGAVLGTLVLVDAPEEPLQIALALTVAAFVVLAVRHAELRLAPATTRRWAAPVGFLAGLFQGAIGASGPVVGTWFHGYRLTPRGYVFTVTVVFGITGLAQIFVLGGQGAFTAELLGAAALAGLAVLCATPLGLRLRRRLEHTGFERAVLVALLISAAALVVDVLA
jgi:uncharacterized membrane protein YfcA